MCLDVEGVEFKVFISKGATVVLADPFSFLLKTGPIVFNLKSGMI